MKILLADDDELILRTVEHKLINEGHEVILARDGQDAIDKIRNEPIDLIITDIMMPFASGTEILTALSEAGKEVPTIVLSSLGQEEVIVEAFDLGAVDFIVKPFNLNELSLRVKRWTRK